MSDIRHVEMSSDVFASLVVMTFVLPKLFELAGDVPPEISGDVATARKELLASVVPDPESIANLERSASGFAEGLVQSLIMAVAEGRLDIAGINVVEE